MSLLPEHPPAVAHAIDAVGLDRRLPPLRRRTDGSIDYDHYLLRARTLRVAALGRWLLGPAGRLVVTPLAAAAAAFRNWRAHRRAVTELLSLDDRLLRDMGLQRSSVDFAVDHGRESWPAPANANDSKSGSGRAA